jgi:hypothetical protein
MVGLSQCKSRYIRELATRICEGRLRFDEVASKKDDEAVITMLVECPGIGRWTAEMFLIFGLKRLDVLAVGDAGLCVPRESSTATSVNRKRYCPASPKPGGPIARCRRGNCGSRWKMANPIRLLSPCRAKCP